MSDVPTTWDILIVEDVDEMRAMLAQLIAGIPGLRVSGLARNVPEARLELSRRKPSLVLLDEVLPGESSVELLAEILADSVPVLLITGVEKATHAVAEGASGRIFKPAWDTLQADGLRFRVAIEQVLRAH